MSNVQYHVWPPFAQKTTLQRRRIELAKRPITERGCCTIYRSTLRPAPASQTADFDVAQEHPKCSMGEMSSDLDGQSQHQNVVWLQTSSTDTTSMHRHVILLSKQHHRPQYVVSITLLIQIPLPYTSDTVPTTNITSDHHNYRRQNGPVQRHSISQSGHHNVSRLYASHHKTSQDESGFSPQEKLRSYQPTTVFTDPIKTTVTMPSRHGTACVRAPRFSSRHLQVVSDSWGRYMTPKQCPRGLIRKNRM